jgi:hypothetical protein
MEDLTGIYSQFENEEDPGNQFKKIVDHRFNDGKLLLKTRYQGSTEEELLSHPEKGCSIGTREIHPKLCRGFNNTQIWNIHGMGQENAETTFTGNSPLT